jgi:hypothetical protein
MNQGRTGLELKSGEAIVFYNLDFGRSNALKTSVDMTKRLKERRVDHRFTKPSFPPQFDPPNWPTNTPHPTSSKSLIGSCLQNQEQDFSFRFFTDRPIGLLVQQ